MPLSSRPLNLDLETTSIAPKGLSSLLEVFGWTDPDGWWTHWQHRGGFEIGRGVWPSDIRDEWLFGVALPLLSQVETLLEMGDRQLLGLSALPGCGKTTLCDWLIHVSEDFGWSVAFLSIDDFYWPGQELERRMAGNPWGVPRALPGSHDLKLMANALDQWKLTGELFAPRFNKSLRQGRGDRSGWVRSEPDLVILEGWFVGVVVPDGQLSVQNFDSLQLTNDELAYRKGLIEILPNYASIWNRVDKLWHLRAEDGRSSRLWKRQQMDTQEQQTGVRVHQSDLTSFVRMIETAIPSDWLQNLNQSDVVIDLTNHRSVREINLK